MIPVLSVEKLSVTFANGRHPVTVVRDVSISLAAGRTLCLVGESGSGKSVSISAVLGLLPRHLASVKAQRIALDGESLIDMHPSRLAAIRGKQMSVVFQDPMTSLNPVLTVGFQIIEAIRLHENVAHRAARDRAVAILERVRIPDAPQRLGAYPHQLSGGMRQRVMIAMALVCRPKVLIADEPTTALDVTVQAQILSLINELKHEFGTAVLLVTHDLGVVAEMADEVAIMYAGRIVEQGPVGRIFDHPSHGYTQGLLDALPAHDANARRTKLREIPGSVPTPGRLPSGCAFSPRCAYVTDACTTSDPPVVTVREGHRSACLHHEAIGNHDVAGKVRARA